MKDKHNGLHADYSDGVHPNKLGYQVMAPLAEKAIVWKSWDKIMIIG
jgi:lysophospholipase L1-like esterase